MIQISKWFIVLLITITSMVVSGYFGILLYKELKPQTLEQKIMHCLELGSDKRATACIKLLPERLCRFEISEIKEHSGRYGEFGSFYKTYEGTIKNLSDRKENLKAMVGKLYTNDRVLIHTGYTTMEEDIDSGASLPFKIDIQYSANEKIESFDNLIKDVYPWFTTCK